MKEISYPIFVGYYAFFELIKCRLVTIDKAEIYAMFLSLVVASNASESTQWKYEKYFVTLQL